MLDDSVAEKQHLQKDANGDNAEQNNSLKERSMYSSFVIENFRLFDYLKLDDLARVNLFFGPNNSGKTSILEAIFTHACGINFVPFLGQVVMKRRGDSAIGPLELGENLITLFRDQSSLPYTFTISAKLIDSESIHTVVSSFHPSSELADLDPRTFGQFSENLSLKSQANSQAYVSQLQIIDEQITIQPVQVQYTFLGKWHTQFDGKDFKLDLNYPLSVSSSSHFKLGYMNDPLAHRGSKSERRAFSHLKRYEILDEFVGEMAKAFPGIRKIDTIPYPDGTEGPVYVWMGDRQLPLFVFGDGMRRWFHLVGHMLVYKNAVHFVDEIDAFFHPDARSHLSRLLIGYAEKYNNQLFLTSHSMEFADAFLEALYGEGGILASRSEDPVRVFTIRPSEDGIDIWKLTGEEAYKNRSLYDLELR